MRNKYHNRKVSYEGVEYDSAREMRRYLQLKADQENGLITDLKRQVPFQLIPAQYGPSEGIFLRGPRKGEPKPGKLMEKACIYLADFTYYKNGELIVEDAKGVRTKEYVIKRKLMLYFHGISIKEI